MLNAIFAGAPALLRAGGASSPGFIVGPIAKLMGIVYDWLFNFIYSPQNFLLAPLLCGTLLGYIEADSHF